MENEYARTHFDGIEVQFSDTPTAHEIDFTVVVHARELTASKRRTSTTEWRPFFVSNWIVSQPTYTAIDSDKRDN